MTVQLIRGDTQDFFKEADPKTQNGNIHAGLLLDKGYPKEDEKDSEAKTSFIKAVCTTKADSFYRNAFTRWNTLTIKDTQRFKQITMKLENRLLIGLSGTGTLETGCAISHSYGMPYIPGSSIKGAVRNWARENLNDCEAQWTALFGNAPEADEKDSFSGLITFHDAWWVPETAPTADDSDKHSPFVQEIVTTHHKDYYGKSGEVKASDMDSPVPNALVGVHGSFLFVIESRSEKHLNIAASMLEKALDANGIGAKTSSGYGYFSKDDIADKKNQTLLLSGEDRDKAEADLKIEVEVRALSETKVVDMFSKNLNKTKKRPEFEQLIQKVAQHHANLINQWAEVTDKKNTCKAYQFLKEYMEK